MKAEMSSFAGVGVVRSAKTITVWPLLPDVMNCRRRSRRGLVAAWARRRLDVRARLRLGQGKAADVALQRAVAGIVFFLRVVAELQDGHVQGQNCTLMMVEYQWAAAGRDSSATAYDT